MTIAILDRPRWLDLAPNGPIENYLVVSALKVDQNGTGSVFVGFNSALNPSTGAFQGATARFFGVPLLTQVLTEQQARGPRQVEHDVVPLEEQRMVTVSDTLSIELSDNLTLRNIASYAVAAEARLIERGRIPVPDAVRTMLHAGEGEIDRVGRVILESVPVPDTRIDPHYLALVAAGAAGPN